jgi:hypothetical protein
MGGADAKRLRDLCDRLVARANEDPSTARAFGDVIAGLLRMPAGAAPAQARRRGRRAQPALDPFQVYRENPEALPHRLAELTLEELRDIVAHHGMDPRRLVMKWKTRDRVIGHIVETVESRARKGDVFRGPGQPVAPSNVGVAPGGTDDQSQREQSGAPRRPGAAADG